MGSDVHEPGIAAHRERRRVDARPAWQRYGFALLVLAVAWMGRRALTPWIGPSDLPYIFFFPAVVAAAWFGGVGPAITAVLVAAVIAEWDFFAPRNELRFHEPIAFGAFALSSAMILLVVTAMHRARRRLVIEMTERERAGAEVAASRELLATTLASIGDGVAVTDASGRVTFLNAEAERLTGWTLAEAAGRSLAEVFRIVNEHTRRAVESPVDLVLRDGRVVGLANHTVLLAKDGREVPIDDSAAPVRRAGGPLEGVVLVFRDVTERRLAAAARLRLAAIVESSGDAIFAQDVDGTIRTWNRAAERLFGWRADEIVGRSILVLVPPDREQEEAEILARLQAGRSTEHLMTVRRAKDGRERTVSVTVSALKDDEGRVTGASKIVRDFSDLVAAQRALASQKELLETTLASIGDAVITTDARGRVRSLNRTAEALTGWKEQDALERPLDEVFRIVAEDTRLPVESPALRAMRDGAIVGIANHTVLLGKDGVERAIDDSAAPIRAEGGEIVGAVLVFRDVTERRRAAVELEQSRERLERQARQLVESDRRKDAFLATLAHELRNPLAPIKNAVTVLQLKGPPDPELAWARGVIDRQVQLMARLLEDLLDVNRLGRGQLELRKEPVTFASVLERAVETARPIVESGGHRLRLDVTGEPTWLLGDPVRLGQVFANLLNNAAKYMDHGGEITLAAARRDSELVVTVRDQGIGIGPDTLPRLFEMFAQGPDARARSQGGLGIGLALAKELVELHGGAIEARSDGAGRGAEFVVRLPVLKEAPAHAMQGPAPMRSVPKRRILIADDSKDNADSLAKMLRMLGHEAHVAYDGESALAAAERLRPEVVLLDLGMPKLDGYEVCRRLRAASHGRSMVLIAQTGWGQDEDRRRTAAAGFDRHLLKPVDASALLDELARIPEARAAMR